MTFATIKINLKYTNTENKIYAYTKNKSVFTFLLFDIFDTVKG